TSPHTVGPVPRAAAGRAAGPAMPPLPRNYGPGGGGGIGRARIREAPFGAAPLETAERAPAGTGLAADAAPQAHAQGRAGSSRQPWYQVIGGPPAARRLAGQAGPAATRAQVPPGQTVAPPASNGSAAADPGETSARALLPVATAHPHGYPVTADGR